MKKTVELEEQLVEEATRVAEAHGSTVTALLEDALREKLDDMRVEDTRKSAQPYRTRVELPVFHGDGQISGVNLDSWAELVEVMDREDGSPGR